LCGYNFIFLSFFLLFTSFPGIFVFKRPSLDGHVPFFKELSEIFPVDAVMPAGQPESLKSVALNPLERRAFAYLAVSGDVLRREPDVLSMLLSGQGDSFTVSRFSWLVCFKCFLQNRRTKHMIDMLAYKQVTKCEQNVTKKSQSVKFL
jgi:hypothetical protein